MSNKTVSILTAAVLIGCASGPSPEQQAQWARERTERQAKQQQEDQRKKMDEEKKRNLIVQSQQELVQNKVASVPSATDIKKAKAILLVVNALAGETLQQDSIKALMSEPATSANPTPPFLMDEGTGKLTLRLTLTNTREFLIGHVNRVDTQVFSGRMQILQNKPIEITEFYIRLITNEAVRATADANSKWKSVVFVTATDEEKAAQLQLAFKELAQLYSPK